MAAALRVSEVGGVRRRRWWELAHRERAAVSAQVSVAANSGRQRLPLKRMRARFNPLTASVWPAYDRIASAVRGERRTGVRGAALHYRIISMAAYPHGFSEMAERLQAGDQAAVGPAVAWLDADPFCLFSGYAKGRVMRYLARSKLSTREASTIRSLLLRVIERGGRPEFRVACRLARKVENPEFRAALRERTEHPDSGARQRAIWMLNACERNDVGRP